MSLVAIVQMSARRGMLICMRTTLNLNDALVAAAKARALAEGTTMTSLIEESLRARLATAQTTPTVQLPTFGTPGTEAFRIDIRDRDALLDAMDSA